MIKKISIIILILLILGSLAFADDFIKMRDKTKLTIRSSATLTTSYVAGTVTRIATHGQCIILVEFTKGSLTSMELKIEESDKSNGTFYQEVSEAVNQGTAQVYAKEYTFTESGNYLLRYPANGNYIKISVKGTGTTTGSSCAVYLIRGWGN